MFPGVVMAIPLYLLLDEARPAELDDRAGAGVLDHVVPFSVFMLKGYFDTIPVRARGGRADRRGVPPVEIVPADRACRWPARPSR
jgi:hypothetical protein